ncbi:Ycf53-like protein [Planktothrix tepida]|uniref:Serine/threonine kinase n=1 Tax=Planktothrix tepida PCC 9214 TaxID=671072 RepID=A0A1J1LU00_9CYAN|nr:GUN4 domain-containing protein [Planktothrix tepida]CAD5978292.1 Ycf53-like protein [Planktothrix tepida]CUR36069.1 Serine/threonine kinase [Planktothrix tepida PCC 9214]
MSFQCPVCNSPYQKPIPEACLVCGWDLQFNLSIPEDLEQEQKRLDWAKKTWERLQTLKLSQQKPHFSSKKRLTLTDILPRLESLELQLQQATLERQHLQSLLDSILHYLKAFNSELSLNQTFPSVTDFDSNITSTFPLSEVGIDYSSLIELLAKGDWKTADEYTWQLILYIGEREAEKWLRVEDIEQFPCTDLNTLNWLWEYYSHGLFSLTSQWQIFYDLDGDYTKFCEQVGWRMGDSWIYYEELNFTLNAPLGHLPIIAWRKRACYGVGNTTPDKNLSSFFSRLSMCSKPLRAEFPKT